MNIELYQKISKVSLGEQKADLVFKNASVINVFTKEIIKTDVAICDGLIAGIGKYSGVTEIDAEGKFLVPGFIDSHLHFESTLLSPAQIIREATLSGTTTYIADPHEAANVSGTDGIDYILDHTKNVHANVFLMMPSCVPAVSFEDNGCTLDADKMERYVSDPRILGLGEVMDCVSVLNGDTEMHKKLNMFSICDGHAPGLTEKQLNAYRLAGITTDHECTEFDYAMEQSRIGMQVHIREGSAAKNLDAIVKGIVKNNINTDSFCFCTDDRHIEDIIKDGHISNCVRKAIALGLNPIDAICMATINSARTYRLDNIGAIAPGYQADLVLLDDLNSVKINSVYYKGKIVDKNQAIQEAEPNKELLRSVNIKPFSKDDIKYNIKSEQSPIIKLVGGQILTKKEFAKVPETEGTFTPSNQYNKAVVLERHKNTGKIGVGIVSGFGIKNGAIASSVSHDSHNIIVLGDNDEDIILAVNEIVRTQGGYVIASKGKIVGSLPLPIMGLMTQVNYKEVTKNLHNMIQRAYDMGVCRDIDPFTTLSFLALPVIPEIRITARGVYDVTQNLFFD